MVSDTSNQIIIPIAMCKKHRFVKEEQDPRRYHLLSDDILTPNNQSIHSSSPPWPVSSSVAPLYSMSNPPEGSSIVHGLSEDTPNRIHAVVIHFSPSNTGQPLCSVRPLSILPSAPTYEKNTTVPAAGFTYKSDLVNTIAPPFFGT